ncbi:hypothetical protein V8F06_013229 [Rhypophila decipiens]
MATIRLARDGVRIAVWAQISVLVVISLLGSLHPQCDRRKGGRCRPGAHPCLGGYRRRGSDREERRALPCQCGCRRHGSKRLKRRSVHSANVEGDPRYPLAGRHRSTGVGEMKSHMQATVYRRPLRCLICVPSDSFLSTQLSSPLSRLTFLNSSPKTHFPHCRSQFRGCLGCARHTAGHMSITMLRVCAVGASRQAANATKMPE